MRRIGGLLLLLALIFSLCGTASAQVFREEKSIPGFVGQYQKQTAWCWAACISMVLQTAGYKSVSQEGIVASRFGRLVNAPAVTEEQLNPSAVADTIFASGKDRLPLTTTILNKPLSGAELVEEIDKNDILIAATPKGPGGHVFVIYGYGLDDRNNVYLKLFDPWPGMGYRVLPYEQVKRSWEKTLMTTCPRKDLGQKCLDEESLAAVSEDVEMRKIEWPKASQNPTVAFTFGYRNTDEGRPIELTVKVQTGTVPRDGDPKHRDEEFIPHSSKEFTLTVPPKTQESFHGTMNWFGVTNERIPSLRADITKCAFAGTPKARTRGENDFVRQKNPVDGAEFVYLPNSVPRVLDRRSRD